MKDCPHCGKKNSTEFHIAKHLTDKGFPTHNKKYASAHEEASKAEKSKYSRSNYSNLKKMDETFPNHELLGKNTKSGKIEVSTKVPKKLRQEVAFHEKFENKILRKK